MPKPAQTLIRVPELVSLHDCCFLMDIALPLFAYCKDVLEEAINTAPKGRILVILNDLAREANDCLLVIHHLHLDHLLITFTDMRKLNEIPGLGNTYAGKFQHVLVFASEPEAASVALALGLLTGLESTKARYTIGVFGKAAPIQEPADRTVHRVTLCYKDKFLMEELLDTLADFNRQNFDARLLVTSIDSAGSNDSELTLVSTGSPTQTVSIDVAWRKTKRLRFKDEAECVTMVPKPARNHILWLHCDRDYRLCLDDQCDHDMLKRCHLTREINALLEKRSTLQRVFYTNRPASHVKINAFIFAGN